MAAKKTNPSFAFVTKFLKRRPKAPYADVKTAAEKAGHTIYPIVYGRALALLGIVKSKARGAGKAAAKKKGAAKKVAAPKAKATRKRGRPAKASAADLGASLVAQIREIEGERNRLRSALVKVRDLLDSAL